MSYYAAVASIIFQKYCCIYTHFMLTSGLSMTYFDQQHVGRTDTGAEVLGSITKSVMVIFFSLH